MFRIFSATLLILSLAAGSAWAQSDTESDASDDTATTDLPLGEPVEPEIAVGDTYAIAEYTDWQLRCIRAAEGDDPCQLYQLLRDQTGRAVAEFTVFPLPEGRSEAVAGGTVITPLETLLTEQLRLSVDGGQARRYPFSFCSTIGCFSRIGLTQPELDAFRAGSSALIVINPAAAPEQRVELTVSLSGFTAGFAALQETLAGAE